MQNKCKTHPSGTEKNISEIEKDIEKRKRHMRNGRWRNRGNPRMQCLGTKHPQVSKKQEERAGKRERREREKRETKPPRL